MNIHFQYRFSRHQVCTNLLISLLAVCFFRMALSQQIVAPITKVSFKGHSQSGVVGLPYSGGNVPVTFLNAQPDNAYKYIVTLQQFDVTLTSNIIDVEIANIYPATTLITFNFYVDTWTTVRKVRARYIILSSKISYIQTSFYYLQDPTSFTVNYSLIYKDVCDFKPQQFHAYTLGFHFKFNATLGYNVQNYSIASTPYGEQFQYNLTILIETETYITPPIQYFLMIVVFNKYEPKGDIFFGIYDGYKIFGANSLYSLNLNDNYNSVLGLKQFSSIGSSTIFNFFLNYNTSNFVSFMSNSAYSTFSYYYMTIDFLFQCGNMTPYYFRGKCYNICPPLYYPNLTNQANRCVSCANQGFHQYFTCSEYAGKFMLNCAYSYNSTVCLNCFVGLPVNGGCSNVAGCVEVTQVNPYTSNHSDMCTRCDYPYFLQIPVNGTCVCNPQPGFVAASACTNMPGCITSVVNRHKMIVECLACNASRNFLRVNDTCVCWDGYFQNNKFCQQICGDGRLFQVKCDDNNTDNGDGCSSVCSVENGYQCTGGSTTHSSICIYTSSLSVTLAKIAQGSQSNSAVLLFQISPNIRHLNDMNFSKYFDLNISDAKVSITAWDYDHSIGVLSIKLVYYESIEGKQATLRMNYDPFIVLSKQKILPFNVNSGGVLFYHTSSQFLTYFKTILKVDTIIALALFVVFSLLQKIEGVHLLSTFQIIYCMHQFTRYQGMALLEVQALSPSMGNLMYFSNQLQSVKIISTFSNLYYDSSNFFFVIYVFGGVVQVMALLLLIAYLNRFLKKDKQQGSKCNWSSTIYDHCLVFLVLGFFIPLQIQMAISDISSYDQQTDNKIFSIFHLSWIVISSLTISYQTIKCSSMSLRNVSCFLLLMSFGLLIGFCFTSVLTSLIIAISFVIFSIKYKPFLSAFSNVFYFYNMAIIILFGLYMYLRERVERMREDSFEIFFIFIVSILMMVAGILGLVNAVIHIYNQVQQYNKKTQAILKIEDTKSGLLDSRVYDSLRMKIAIEDFQKPKDRVEDSQMQKFKQSMRRKYKKRKHQLKQQIYDNIN